MHLHYSTKEDDLQEGMVLIHCKYSSFKYLSKRSISGLSATVIKHHYFRHFERQINVNFCSMKPWKVFFFPLYTGESLGVTWDNILSYNIGTGKLPGGGKTEQRTKEVLFKSENT